MKHDVLKTLAGVVLIATGSFVAFKFIRRRTEGTIARMKAPFKAQVLPYPITRDVVSSSFGEQRTTGPHLGIDLKTKFTNGQPDPHGTPDIGMIVTSPVDGVVKDIFNNASGGIQITIKANDGHVVGFAHLLKTVVNEGETVTAGDVIAGAGNTGKSSGPHLHLSVRDPSGKLVDPAPFLGL